MSYSTMPSAPLRLASLLDRGAWLQGSNLIIEARVDGGYDTISFAAHLLQAKKIALALQAVGVRRGDRVATCCWNTNRHLQLYHAVPCMGAVLHPLNIRLGPADQSFIMGHANDRVLFVDEDLLPRVAECDAAVLARLQLVVVTNEDSRPIPTATLGNLVPAGCRVVNMAQFLAPLATVEGEARARAYVWPEDIPEDHPASMCYTSGTTGKPKGVVYSHKSTFIHTLAMPAKDNHNTGGADVLLPVVPYFHANGWGVPFMALMLGARVVHTRHLTDPASILRMCVDQGVTQSAAVPTIWQTLRKTLEADIEGYRSTFKVQQVLCGGSAPPPEMMDWYNKHFGVSFVQGWGMTETSPMGTFGRRVSHYHHAGLGSAQQFLNITKAGVPAPGVELKIVDSGDFSRTLPNDGVASGELLVRGPWVTARYYDTDGGIFVQPGHWLATGDVASLSGDGALVIRDRSKDVIKSGGEWISSVDLENFIAGMPEKFAKFQLPDDVLVWPALPLTGTGKLDKKNIRARLQAEGYVLPDLRAAAAKEEGGGATVQEPGGRKSKL